MIDLTALSACTRCSLSATRQRVVIGSGPSEPDVMIIGEAPGRFEDEGGEPFIGPSGRLLFALLDEVVALDRASCFVTNVVKCRPPANRTPTPSEIATCRVWLDEQLASVAPRAVLCLGNTASRSVLRFEAGIGTVHGRVVDLAGRPALATYHPAAALRGGPSVVDVTRADLATLRRLLETT